MGLKRPHVCYNRSMTGKQVQILRTDELDIRLASDGKTHMLPNQDLFPAPDAPFRLTVNNVTVDISLDQVMTMRKSIDLYLESIGYKPYQLDMTYKYVIHPEYIR